MEQPELGPAGARRPASIPTTQEGWGVRNWDWQFSVGVQQEMAPRVSVDVSYSRRWWGNFFVTHNRALTAAD